MFYVDTVTSSAAESKFNVDADRYCTRTSVFHRGMHAVWRMMAWDNTGKELQPADVESAVLKIPGASDVKLNYGQHLPGVWFWTASWDIPMDYPLGAVDFTIALATKSGKTGTFRQIPISIPDRNIESLMQIVA